MKREDIPLAVLAWSGMEAIDVLFDTRHSSISLEARIYETLLYADDGWPFKLRQRLVGRMTDEQYTRLIRVLRAVGSLEPPVVWFCRLIADLADHANNTADWDPWRLPARRILDALQIRYRH